MVREQSGHVEDMDDLQPQAKNKSTKIRNNNENRTNPASSVVAPPSGQRSLEHNVNIYGAAELAVGSKRQAENIGQTPGKVRRIGDENNDSASNEESSWMKNFHELYPKLQPKEKIEALHILMTDKACKQVITHVVEGLVSKAMADKEIHPSDAAFNDVLNTCRVIETHFKKWVYFSNNIQDQMKEYNSKLKNSRTSSIDTAPEQPTDDPSLDSNHHNNNVTDNNPTPSFPKPSSQLATPPKPPNIATQGVGDDIPQQAAEDVSSNETEKMKKKIVTLSKQQPVVVIETSVQAEQAIRQEKKQTFKSKEVSTAPATNTKSSSTPDQPTATVNAVTKKDANQEIEVEESPACPEVVDNYEYEQCDVAAMAAEEAREADNHWQPLSARIAGKRKAPANITPLGAKRTNNNDDSAAPKTARLNGNDRTPQSADVPGPTVVLKKEPTSKKPENKSSNGKEPPRLQQQPVEVVDLTLDSDDDEPPTRTAPTVARQQPPKPVGGVATRRRIDEMPAATRDRAPTRASVARNVIPVSGTSMISLPPNTQIIIPPRVPIIPSVQQQPQRRINQPTIVPNPAVRRPQLQPPPLPKHRIMHEYEDKPDSLPPKMCLKFDEDKKNALQFSVPDHTSIENVETYELWACNSMTSKWVNVGEPIQALELPVVCTMNMMSKNSGKVYFYAVRGRDKNGQSGPFSNILCSLDWGGQNG